MKNNATAKKLNILQGEYNDNEYITSSTWDAVPIEVGKTYIMFILPIGILNPRDYTLSPDGVSCSNIMVKRSYMSVLLLWKVSVG